MCRIIKKVTEAIASLRLEFIHYPDSNQSLRQTKENFYNIAHFPRVVGAIDCTHVKILSPGIIIRLKIINSNVQYLYIAHYI